MLLTTEPSPAPMLTLCIYLYLLFPSPLGYFFLRSPFQITCLESDFLNLPALWVFFLFGGGEEERVRGYHYRAQISLVMLSSCLSLLNYRWVPHAQPRFLVLQVCLSSSQAIQPGPGAPGPKHHLSMASVGSCSTESHTLEDISL